jgi:Prokaryotic RING finger family 1
MQPGDPDHHQPVAGQAETGRACPYCRFPLKEGVQIVVCGVCGAPHHADCWHDNGGCAVIACAGGPATDQTGAPGEEPTVAYPAGAGAQTAAHPTAAGPPHMQASTPPAPVPPMWPPPQPPPSHERRGPSLGIAVIVLAIAVGGAAVAVVLSRQRGNARLAGNTITEQRVTVPETSVTTTNESYPETTSTSEGADNATTSPAEGALPDVPSEQMQSEIQQMLLTWHEDVVHKNYSAAWELLSHRKQIQDEREYGYSTWVKNQSTLNPYLNPSGLQASIQQTEADEAVALVDVTGMTWDKPGAPCTEWSGITWVKYEDGSWKYDPGYSTTPQREREWKPRFAELLGGGC